MPVLRPRHARIHPPPPSPSLSPPPTPLADLGPMFTNRTTTRRAPRPTRVRTPNSTPRSSRKQLVNDFNQTGQGFDFSSRPYVCDHEDCNKAFARKSDLARHYKIHTNERQWVCPDQTCQKAFIQRSALTVHYRVHTGEKPHKCESCDKTFADSSSLARHRRIHTGTRPYACQVPSCGRSFARRNTILKHYKRQHPHMPLPASHLSITRGRAPEKTGFYTVDSKGQRYFLQTPPTGSGPHGYAASYPSESAALTYNGGFATPFSGGRLRSSHAHAGTKHAHTHESAQLEAQAYAGSALHTPLSAASGTGTAASGGTPNIPTPSSTVHSNESDAPSVAYTDGFVGQPGLGFSHGSATPYLGGNPAHFVYAGHPFARNIAAPGGPVMTYQLPHGPRPMSVPTAPFGHVGGGFHSHQLALPEHMQVPQQPMFWHTNIGPPVLVPSANRQERAGSPELVDVNSMPTFAMQGPAGQTMPLSSAVNPSPFSQAQMAATQVLSTPHQAHRLHSAPPTLLRFNSMPVLPTNSIDADPDAGEAEAHSAGDEPSEDWEDADDIMLSRGETMVPDEPVTAAPKMADHWGQPIAHPVNPSARPYDAQSASSTSTLVGPLDQQMPPVQYVHAGPGPHATPASAPAPTPMRGMWYLPTPVTAFRQQHQQPGQMMLGSPAAITSPFPHALAGSQYAMHSAQQVHAHHMQLQQMQAMSVQRGHVGLGIQGVEMPDRSGAIRVDSEAGTPPLSGLMKGEPKSGSGEEEEDVSMDEEEVGSDDDFVPGRRASKARRGRSAAARGRRR